MITVFTPTYNRCEELKRLYASLLAQSYGDFEWLIVDDGSTDETRAFAESIAGADKISINYVYKENGGKQSAYNCGLDNCRGDIFLCIDSDDILKSDILGEIAKDFDGIKSSDDIAGVAYLQSYISDGKHIIGTEFPEDEMICGYYDIYNKYNVSGDKLIVLKADVAKKYYFPLLYGEKFVPEALIFNRISKSYRLLFKNTIAAHKEYLSDGYSNNYFALVKKNPNGNLLFFKELYDFKPSFYNTYGYILFSLYAGRKFTQIYKGHKAKLKILLLYAPTLILSKLR